MASPLAKLVHQAPDLDAMMTEAGVVPVACYMVGPRVEDLTSLDILQKRKHVVLALGRVRLDAADACPGPP